MMMMLAMSKVVAEYLLAFCFALSLVTRVVKAKLDIIFISAIMATDKKSLFGRPLPPLPPKDSSSTRLNNSGFQSDFPLRPPELSCTLKQAGSARV